MKNSKLLLYLTGFLGLLGVLAIAYRLVAGMQVTALTSSVPWGMWVAFYIYFIGLSAGSFLFSTLIYVFGQKDIEKAGRLALLSAIFALIAGMLFIWIDLGHPWRFLNVFIFWNYPSVLAWESAFYLIYVVIIAAELYFLMRDDLAGLKLQAVGFRKKLYHWLSLGYELPASQEERQAKRARALKITVLLGAIGIPIAIGVHGGTGALFAVVKARPYWYSPIFPIIFLVSALVSGAGLMTFLYGFFGDKKDPDHPSIVKKLAMWMIIFLSIDILLLVADVLVSLYGQIPEHMEIWHQILFGPYWYMFWVGEAGFVILIPLLIYIFKRNDINWLRLAGGSAVIGIIAVRFNIVIPAFVAPPVPGLEGVLRHWRMAFEYFPSFWEWVTSIGGISLIVFLFLLAYRNLPLFENPELETSKHA